MCRGVVIRSRPTPCPGHDARPDPVRPLCVLIACALLGLIGCRPEPAAPGEGPRLILLVVVDQMRYDYLDRFQSLFQGGLQYLRQNGVSFTDAHHHHAKTETAPGHATIASGRHPSHHGIVGNSWYERQEGERVGSVQDAELDASPRRFIGTALGDWLKAQDRHSKVFAASGLKDRTAILLGGPGADAAFWYDASNGGFETSRYYMKKLPSWLAQFNQERHLDAHFGHAWEPSPMPAEQLEALAIESQHGLGILEPEFPHTFGGFSSEPDTAFYRSLAISPYFDAQLGRFSRRLIEEEQLGADGHIDLLALGFSALDTAGHYFGPNSREFLEVLLGLDQTLGQLLTFLDQRIGLDRVIVALSSDHGVLPMPEYRQRHGLPGKRLGREEILCVQQLPRVVADELGEGEWFADFLVLDQATLDEKGLSRERVEGVVADLLEQCPSVARVWTRTELLQGRTRDAPYWEYFLNSFHPERGRDFEVRFDEVFLATRSVAASHGSTYPYDTQVPIIFATEDTVGRDIAERAYTVDIAPTLAALAGVEVPEVVDGEDRSDQLKDGLAREHREDREHREHRQDDE
jgi:predicted AlkP superfamily pyrophosphatase or phosphodiesterase